ncbi:MAG: porin [Rhodanobacter sp.]
MRSRLITVAIAAGLGVTSFSIIAAPAQHKAAATSTTISGAEVEQLKAQLAALQAQVASLEERTDAQSDINVATNQSVTAVQQSQVANDKKVAAVDKWVNNTSLSGKMYFDFSNINESNSDKGHTDKSGVGLDVKRFYLGVDHKFNDIWSANLTTDFSYASNIGQTSLYVKKAYVQGKFSKAAVLRVGSTDLPWVPYAEKAYGFRYVENTLIDRLKYGTSADWGVHLGGKIGAGGSLSYAVAALNGGGYKNPSRSKSVDFEGRVSFSPFQNVMVAVGGYRGKLGKEVESTALSNTAQRGNVLIAYVSEKYRFGAEYFTANNWNNVLTPRTDKADGYSMWGSVALTDVVSLFARYDNANLSKNLDHQAKDTYYNLGVQYQVTKGFKLAGVWKHEDRDKSVNAPLLAHVQRVKTNEIGVWGEVAF